jgi:hypothetical protein
MDPVELVHHDHSACMTSMRSRPCIVPGLVESLLLDRETAGHVRAVAGLGRSVERIWLASRSIAGTYVTLACICDMPDLVGEGKLWPPELDGDRRRRSGRW